MLKRTLEEVSKSWARGILGAACIPGMCRDNNLDFGEVRKAMLAERKRRDAIIGKWG
jgi:hypothetical protein